MPKRSPRTGKPVPTKNESLPLAPVEHHSGEGSASALDALQRLESRRIPEPPPELPAGGSDEPIG